MKKLLLVLLLAGLSAAFNADVQAQCSICNKTVQQLGKGPAQGFNSGIVYLMLIPYVAIGVVGYKWWKSDRGNS
jgi:hypothetical protein